VIYGHSLLTLNNCYKAMAALYNRNNWMVGNYEDKWSGNSYT
jgi:hypothetical protein